MHRDNYFIITFITIILISCSRDNFEPNIITCDESFTYVNQIAPIINSSCAYSGCHDGTGIGPNNYLNYDGILPHLQSGSFRERVIDQKDNAVTGMPPDTFVYPQSIKSDLTLEELEMITCWLDADYPEN